MMTNQINSFEVETNKTILVFFSQGGDTLDRLMTMDDKLTGDDDYLLTDRLVMLITGNATCSSDMLQSQPIVTKLPRASLPR